MTVHDNDGKKFLAKSRQARQEFRDLAFAANRAVNDAIMDVKILEGRIWVTYQPNEDPDKVNREWLRESTADAVGAVKRVKRALLDVLGYISNLNIPQYAPDSVHRTSGTALEKQRADFFAGALAISDGLKRDKLDPAECARTLAAMDDMVLSLQAARDTYCREGTQ